MRTGWKTRWNGTRGQTATEYLLTISFLVVAISFAFYQLIGPNGGNGPIKESFNNVRGVVEAPYP